LFISKFWTELTKLLKIDLQTSTAYHPQSDNSQLTERTLNQTLETYLHAYVSYQQDDWVLWPSLHSILMRTICLHTKHSPFYSLYYGYHPSFEPRVSDNTTVPAAGDLARRLEQLHFELGAELRHAQDLQAKYYNTKVLTSPTYQPDQLV